MKRYDRISLSEFTRTVWVFGAGASVVEPYKVPTQYRLLSHFANMTRPGPDQYQKNLDALRQSVRAHCKAVQPGLQMEDPRLSLEEVFSAYELAILEKRSSPDAARQAERALADLREALRLATQVYGPGTLKKWMPHGRGTVRSPYAELLERLVPLTSGSEIRHVLVTMNYDINLDRCIINLRKARPDHDLDYGISLSNYRFEESAPEFEPPRGGSSTLLLRLHGALNWIRCWACHSIFTTVNKHAYVTETDKCWACGRNRLDYILVHPSFLRRYDDPILQIVWGRFQEELVRADRWVFVGYSLPAPDVHFRELMRDCIRVRKERGMATEVLMVGLGPTDREDWKNTVASYSAVCVDNLAVWNATSGGFSDFVQCIEA